MSEKIYIESYPEGATGTIKKPSGGGGGPHKQFLDAYFHGLKALDLEDPSGAREHYERGEELEREAHAAARTTGPAQESAAITDALAAGEITVEAADKRLAKLDSDPDATEKARRERASLLKQAASKSFAMGVAAIHRADFDWIGELNRLAVACLDDIANPEMQELYRAVHRFADSLLGVITAWADGSSTFERQFARPDLVHFHILNHARTTKELGRRGVGAVVYVERRPVDPKPLTLEDIATHRDEWGPGVFTAEQTIENVKAIIAAEEAGAERAVERQQGRAAFE